VFSAPDPGQAFVDFDDAWAAADHRQVVEITVLPVLPGAHGLAVAD